MNDPFVDEIRTIRKKHSRLFNNNLHSICEDLRKYQDTLIKNGDISEKKIFTKMKKLIKQ